MAQVPVSVILLLLVPAGKVLGELVVISQEGVDRYSSLHARLLLGFRELLAPSTMAENSGDPWCKGPQLSR